ncbi:hypothetical protein EIN_151730 [Entamoeba invadens IP1]|uniref:Uncharacterized protein n=1 Tax=Entamoeba invadens IP1 TaxID=370355 RepID=A0A0A1UEJ4_ENTIV|nr:hypothetical protein EIN_151730 [Entamoeba invadens IP1]ELP91246.1 hypothetical protein EIN_151730 [Entamoeba invadens IP1]|eukprot:XP_004258017.1 hypothetical protein EIN_151730 [Entamoeba invadens IP1]
MEIVSVLGQKYIRELKGRTCIAQMFMTEAETVVQRGNVVYDKEHPWNAPKYRLKKRENRDLETYQLAIFMVALNQFADISIERPAKMTKNTLSIPKICKIRFSNHDVIDVQSLALKQCKSIRQKEIQEGVNQSTATRRIEKNRKVFIQNLVIDLLAECNVVLITDLARLSGKALRTERLQELWIDKTKVVGKEDIISKGSAINQYLIDCVEKTGHTSFKKNCRELQQFLLF